MADNIKSIQLRMNTVNQVSKITNAMKLVSMSKLQSYQRKINELKDLVDQFDVIQTVSYEQTDDSPVLAVCIASDLGLASLYNQSIQKALLNKNPEAVLWLGNQGYERIEKNSDIQIINEKTSSDNLDLEDTFDEMVKYMNEYKIELAVPKMDGDELIVEWKDLNRKLLETDFVIYEPDYKSANQRYQEFYIYLTLHETYYQSKFSENMTRRIAMEQATENANDMREMLNNRYNQIRQEEITQEILELASGVE